MVVRTKRAGEGVEQEKPEFFWEWLVKEVFGCLFTERRSRGVGETVCLSSADLKKRGCRLRQLVCWAGAGTQGNLAIETCLVEFKDSGVTGGCALVTDPVRLSQVLTEEGLLLNRRGLLCH